MNKPIAGSELKIAWAFVGLVVLAIGPALTSSAQISPAQISPAQLSEGYSSLTLAGNGAHSAHIAQESQSTDKSFNAGWRYTKNGWQNRTEWQDPAPVSKPALHPAIVGSLQLLISLAALVWFSTSKQRFA